MQQGLASPQAAALLECAYKLFVEHVVPGGAPTEAEVEWRSALLSVQVCCFSAATLEVDTLSALGGTAHVGA